MYEIMKYVTVNQLGLALRLEQMLQYDWLCMYFSSCTSLTCKSRTLASDQ